MQKEVTETPINFDPQSAIRNIYKLVNSMIGMVIMFAVCLGICHSPGLIHTALGYFSH